MSTSKGKKVWFITVRNSGFGRSLAEAVLAQGDRIVATTRHPEEIEDLVQQYPNLVKAVSLGSIKKRSLCIYDQRSGKRCRVLVSIREAHERRTALLQSVPAQSLK